MLGIAAYFGGPELHQIVPAFGEPIFLLSVFGLALAIEVKAECNEIKEMIRASQSEDLSSERWKESPK